MLGEHKVFSLWFKKGLGVKMNKDLLHALRRLITGFHGSHDVITNEIPGYFDLVSLMSDDSPDIQDILDEIIRRSASNGQLDILILAHSAGGSIKRKSPNDLLPIEFAIRFGAEKCALYLAQMHDDRDELHRAAELARNLGYMSIQRAIKEIMKEKALVQLCGAMDITGVLSKNSLLGFKDGIMSKDQPVCQAALNGIIIESCRVYNTLALQLAHRAGGDLNSNPRLAHVAAENGAFSCLKYLHENGVDITKADESSITPQDLLRQKGHYSFAEWMDGLLDTKS